MDELTLSRFWSKVNQNGPVHPILKTKCWLWVANENGKGYGGFKLNGKMTSAHRASWLIHHGREATACVLHKCDNRRCVNPDHLFEGTAQDNANDMVQKGRSTVGEVNPASKLNKKDVTEIRKLYSTGNHSQRELAGIYGVSQMQISYVTRRKQWNHVHENNHF
jgi:hypothetical protein